MDVLFFSPRWFWMTHVVHLSGLTTDALLQKERHVIESQDISSRFTGIPETCFLIKNVACVICASGMSERQVSQSAWACL